MLPGCEKAAARWLFAAARAIRGRRKFIRLPAKSVLNGFSEAMMMDHRYNVIWFASQFGIRGFRNGT
jgi:hypothetical protein